MKYILALASLFVFFQTLGAMSLHEEARATNTCGNPDTAMDLYQGYSPSKKAHVIHERWAFVNADVVGDDWQIQGRIGRIWLTQEAGTSPLYRLLKSSTGGYIFVISTDGTVPSSPGFTTAPTAIGFVYATQVCGSVPMFSVSRDSTGDHWYTTDNAERDKLIEAGWTDAGINFYVLPLA